MPGTFTHFMVAEQALAQLKDQDATRVLGEQIEEQKCFLLQGSISPDYPFIAERVPGPSRAAGNWGNRMHSENTGAMIDTGLKLLRLRADQDRQVCQAWLFGHASHLVADTVVHPIVNLAVGGVAFCTEEDHGYCEMTQDAWIFRELQGVDIKDGGYLAYLHACCDVAGPDHIQPAVERFWRDCLKGAHPLAGDAHDDIAPGRWHAVLLELLPAAAHPGVLKYIGSVFHLSSRLYKPLADISEEQVEKYVLRLALPNGTTDGIRWGSFREVFEKAVTEVVRVWQSMAQDLAALDANPRHQPSRYPNWDLDTGLKMPTWEAGRYDGLDRLALW